MLNIINGATEKNTNFFTVQEKHFIKYNFTFSYQNITKLTLMVNGDKPTIKLKLLQEKY